MDLGEEILALCRQMGAGEEQDGLLLPLIEAAQDSLQLRLKAGVSPSRSILAKLFPPLQLWIMMARDISSKAP